MRWTQGSPRYRSGLAKELNIDKRFIEPLNKLDDGLLYLIHFNAKDKYQYDINSVFGSLVPRLENLVIDGKDGRDDVEKLEDLVFFIERYEGPLKTSVFMRYCIRSRQNDVYRKYMFSFHKMIDEHNFCYRNLKL